jgi:hypothetical protein
LKQAELVGHSLEYILFHVFIDGLETGTQLVIT